MSMRLVFLGLLLVMGGAMLAVKPLLGVSPLAIGDLAAVASGLGAKLACSHRYITGLSESRIAADLETYSPAYALIDIGYDPDAGATRASLFGLAPRRAVFRPGLGCTLEIGDTRPLDELRVPELVEPRGSWPLGDSVTTIEASSQSALEALLAADNAEGYVTRALLVVHRGAVVAESYADGFDSKTPHLGWSMGKSLTAMLLGVLETRGLLSPADDQLFGEWRDDERSGITLQDMLQMSSGLAFDEEYAPGSDATAMLFTTHSASAVALAMPLIHSPGQHFAYSSGTTNLLARYLVDHLGGSQAAVDFLYRDFLQPLGMRNTTLEPDPSGVFVGSSYVYASARDWARLGQLLLERGSLNGRRLLSESWVDRAILPNVTLNDPRYGYQLWLNGGGDSLRWPDLPADAYAMTGNRSQVVMMVPSAGLVIVRLGWSSDPYPVSTKFGRLLYSVARET
jgi:CubicO group peptidase (beta-lactamase class C family)